MDFNNTCNTMKMMTEFYNKNPDMISNMDTSKVITSKIDDNSAMQACNIKLNELELIYLNELESETIHYGKVIYCEITCDSVIRIAGIIHALVMDINGDIIRLELNNYVNPDENDLRLKKGVKLIIKEPYIKYNDKKNDSCIKLDNPSTNLINLTELGIDNLELDSLKNMDIEEMNVDNSDINGMNDDEYLYWIGKYEDIIDINDKAQERMNELNGIFHDSINPFIKKYIFLWKLVFDVKNENKKKKLYKEMDETKLKIMSYFDDEMCDYIHNNIECQYISKDKGRGIIAIDDIDEFTVLSIEKALFYSEINNESTNINIENILFTPIDNPLKQKLIINVLNNVNKYKDIQSLWKRNRLHYMFDGINSFDDKIPNKNVFRYKNIDSDGNKFISYKQIRTIIDLNAFSASDSINDNNKISRGIWVFTALYNHSKKPNAIRIGFKLNNERIIMDVSIRKINKNEEICHRYTLDDTSLWGIKDD